MALAKHAAKPWRSSAAEQAIIAGFEPRGAERNGSDAESSLAELHELASSAGAAVTAALLQTRAAANAATLFGSGKVEELRALAASTGADLVIVDHQLSPTQQRNLEKALNCKVIDRTQLILDIFASRARTREGRLQVELAQLNYLLPRLSGQGVSMSRLGGGIGTRGPGETKLETDRRRTHRRIKSIEQSIEKVRSGRELHRRQRQAVPLPTLALVGYTNAGKSTLFNRLTQAEVLADEKVFATLDPTVRTLQLPSKRKALLSDTVGFIRNLPTTLVHAFRATLEEVADAALILHVVDASALEARAQIAQVNQVLGEIGAIATPRLLVLNKSDLLAAQSTAVFLAENSRFVLISARTGEGINELLAAAAEALPEEAMTDERFALPAAKGAELALLYRVGKVRRVEYHYDVCEVEASVPRSLRRRLARYLVRA